MNNETKKDLTGFMLLFLGIVIIALLTITILHYFKIDIITKPIPYGIALFILTIPFIIYGLDIIKNGLIKMITLKPTLDSLATISILSSFIYSLVNLLSIFKNNTLSPLYFEISALTIYFIKLGRYYIKKKINQNTKSTISLIEDTACSIYLSLALIAALTTFVILLELGKTLNDSLNPFINILIISCPCFIGLSYTISKIIELKNINKSNITINSIESLEILNKIDTIVIDEKLIKSDGSLQISEVNNYSNYSDEELLNVIASIEANSNHLYANTFKSIEHDKEVKNYKEISNIGISGKINKTITYIGNEKILSKQKIKNNHKTITEKAAKKGETVLFIIEKKKIIGIVTLKETVKKDIKEDITELIKMEKDLYMLSNQTNDKTLKLAESFYIKKLVSKNEIRDSIKKFQDEKRNIMLINKDESNIKLVFNLDNDINSIIMSSDDLKPLINLFKSNKKERKITKQNLFWTFFLNTLLIPIAVGILNKYKFEMSIIYPLITMLISSIFVTLNSLRLNR